jgi:hypothetical protein
MDESLLRSWESFYVIVGSSAGALTGLQFVVLTLISEAGRLRGSGETLAAFGSPNVVHFCTALLVSALCSAPWHGLGPLGTAITLVGVGGVIYSIAVLRRALRQSDYQPVFEDWAWHTALPMLAYCALLVGGIFLRSATDVPVYAIGAAALLLVFIGIHNAWDTVAYVLVDRSRRMSETATRAGMAPPAASGGSETDDRAG